MSDTEFAPLLTQVGWERLGRALLMIEAKPELYYQGQWGMTQGDQAARLGRPVCDTAHCVGGWIAALSHGAIALKSDPGYFKVPAPLMNLSNFTANSPFIVEAFREQLGLTPDAEIHYAHAKTIALHEIMYRVSNSDDRELVVGAFFSGGLDFDEILANAAVIAAHDGAELPPEFVALIEAKAGHPTVSNPWSREAAVEERCDCDMCQADRELEADEDDD